MSKIPSSKYSWTGYLKNIFPGFMLCVVLGAVARFIYLKFIPEQLFIFNHVIIAILLGLILKNMLGIPKAFNSGIEFSTKICLYIGIVLLGATLNLYDIFSVGAAAILMVAVSITFSILICGWIVKKITGNERWGHLIGTGLGVCGVSAIIALAPVIKARQKEVFTAIGIAILNDVIVLAALPLIAHAMGWSDLLAGFVAGAVPANTAQAIAIGHAYSDSAGTIATIVKSARNTLLPVVVVVMTYSYIRKGLPVTEKVRPGLLWSKFPKFIVGLLIAASLSTFGLIGPQGIAAAKTLSSWFFVVCFVGIGAGINLKELGRQDLAVIGFGLLMTILLGFYAYFYSTIILVL
ncbi:MAG: putative sulfate exporter family transporter [Bacillota bacterium]|nr:putative sulfate exporter family transporter [Bacillota bacterium]